MKLNEGKHIISQLEHLTAEYTFNFSTEKLIKNENQYVMGVVFSIIYNIIPPL